PPRGEAARDLGLQQGRREVARRGVPERLHHGASDRAGLTKRSASTIDSSRVSAAATPLSLPPSPVSGPVVQSSRLPMVRLRVVPVRPVAWSLAANTATLAISSRLINRRGWVRVARNSCHA